MHASFPLVSRNGRLFASFLVMFPFVSPSNSSSTTWLQLFERSDFISLHTPLTPDTRGLIGKANLNKCKKGVRIINCARGGIIDPKALVAAINAGKVRIQPARLSCSPPRSRDVLAFV